MTTKSNQFIVKQCTYLETMANNIKDEEKQFNFVRTHILSLDDCMQEGEEKTKLLNGMVKWAIRKFNTPDKFQSDTRMLGLWQLLGKYSSSDLKMEGVLQNLYRVGHFKTCPEFYLIWAEHWATEGDRSNFDKTVQLCAENCGINPFECKEMFMPLFGKYFDSSIIDTTNTMALIEMMAKKPDTVHPDLTHLNNRTIKFPDSSNVIVSKQQQIQPPKVHLQEPTVLTNLEEFSVFRDPTMNFAQQLSQPFARQSQSNLQQMQQEQENESPFQQQIEQQSSSVTFASGANTFVAEAKNKQRISTILCSEVDVTLSGSHGKSTSTVYTSTPRRSIALGTFEPVFETTQDEFIKDLLAAQTPLSETDVDGGNKEKTTTNGSKSRRSLSQTCDQASKEKPTKSLVAEAIDRMKRSSVIGVSQNIKTLNIASTIEEVEEERENTSSFASPLSKKKKNELFNNTTHLSTTIPTTKPGTGTTQDEFMKDLLAAQTPLMSGTDVDGGLFATENKEEIATIGSKSQKGSLNQTCDQASKEKPKMSFVAEAVYRIESTNEEKKENTLSSFASPLSQKNKDELFNETTHLNTTIPVFKPGTANPWDENKREEILSCAPLMVECREVKSESCPRMEINRTITLGHENFLVEKLLGQGGFARVYKVKSLDTLRTYAVKYEAPACPWEVYICAMLRCRMPSEFLKSVMHVENAYVFQNASAIVYEFNQYGTLLDLANVFKRNGAEMDGLLVTYFGIQLGRIIEQVHAANIIHADMKPDNVMLTISALNEKETVDQLLRLPALKLIDWGRSIDMEHFKHQEFVGRAGTEQFDCVEMISGMPWTFQTDFYGFVASMYVLMKGEYLVTFKRGDRIVPTKVLKRRMQLYSLWVNIFDEFLNIPSCQELPNWSNVNQTMVEQLQNAVSQVSGLEWKKALGRFNAYVKQQTFTN